MNTEKLFPDDWPEDCPPQDSIDASGEVFRIVKNDPPEHSDFLTHQETGRYRQAPQCLRCGLSVFSKFRDAVHQREVFPKLGDVIAKGQLHAYHGKTKQTKGQQPSHTTWWVYAGVNRHDPFSVIQEEG